MRLSQFLQGFGPNNYIEEIEECEDNTYGVVVSSFVRCCVCVVACRFIRWFERFDGAFILMILCSILNVKTRSLLTPCQFVRDFYGLLLSLSLR